MAAILVMALYRHTMGQGHHCSALLCSIRC